MRRSIGQRESLPWRDTGLVADESEIQRIAAVLRESGWAHHPSLDRETRLWAQLSAEVNNYTATVDDYTNDLCSRDYLAEVASLASDGLRGRIEHQVAAADETFRASTVENTTSA